uniref:Uncharacterized protein n=1 Tax=Picornavirales sp. TaxID=1955153 RepID=A0A6M3YTZ6_9VIRU|nr:MAG: hypothetical protein 4 [Picornavirales sp.]
MTQLTTMSCSQYREFCNSVLTASYSLICSIKCVVPTLNSYCDPVANRINEAIGFINARNYLQARNSLVSAAIIGGPIKNHQSTDAAIRSSCVTAFKLMASVQQNGIDFLQRHCSMQPSTPLQTVMDELDQLRIACSDSPVFKVSGTGMHGVTGADFIHQAGCNDLASQYAAAMIEVNLSDTKSTITIAEYDNMLLHDMLSRVIAIPKEKRNIGQEKLFNVTMKLWPFFHGQLEPIDPINHLEFCSSRFSHHKSCLYCLLDVTHCQNACAKLNCCKNPNCFATYDKPQIENFMKMMVDGDSNYNWLPRIFSIYQKTLANYALKMHNLGPMEFPPYTLQT